jgi:replicative DNA helicase
MQEIVVISNLENYISLVQEKYLRRLLIDLGYKIVNSGYLVNVSIEKILEELEEKIYSLTGKKKDEALVPMTELLSNTIVELKQKSTNPSLLGLSSSYVPLDSLLHGFQNSDLIIIAGRPSMGKTSFALNLASNISKNYNLPIRFIIEDNGVSTNTPTLDTWGGTQRDIPSDVIFYTYEKQWPHYGTGKWVIF